LEQEAQSHFLSSSVSLFNFPVFFAIPVTFFTILEIKLEGMTETLGVELELVKLEFKIEVGFVFPSPFPLLPPFSSPVLKA